ncbi:helix-turn-helix domain-containing protein [Brevibacterium sp. JNUCC-42]|nr:helix-turn-helix domain-containing protein [Brevibacterium sp. JNUCC-42]
MRNNLKGILEERGIKQKWLQERVGLSRTALNRVINGLSTPSLDAALRIAKVLEIPVEAIWQLDD